jgi:hypothetical protein
MNTKIKLCLFTVTYKRPELTEYVLNYYKNIKVEIEDLCDLKMICIGSDGEIGKTIAEKHGFEYIEYKNNPVSQKHNFGAQSCKKYNPDGVIYVGSDDIMSIEFFKHYIGLIKNGFDFCGVTDIYFLTKDRLGYWNGYPKNSTRFGEPIGPGKLYSKSLMEKLNWRPWGDENWDRKLDTLVTKNLSKLTYKGSTVTCEKLKGYFIDIKTNINISDINDFIYDKEFGIDYINQLNIDYYKIKDILITKKK